MTRGQFANRRWMIGTVIVITLLTSTLSRVLPISQEAWNNRIVSRLNALNSVIPPNSTIISSPMLVFGLGFDRRVIDWPSAFPSVSVNSQEPYTAAIEADFIVLFVDEVPKYVHSEYGSIDNKFLQKYIIPEYSNIQTLPGVNGMIEVWKRVKSSVPQ